MPSTRFPRSIALAAAMAVSSTVAFGGAAYAANAEVAFGTAKPASADVAGATKDTFTVPAVKGVAQYIAKFTGGTNAGRTIVYTPSTSKIPTGGATQIVLTPIPAAGYDLPADAETFTLNFDVAATPVEATAPTVSDAPGRKADKIVIKPVANVMWQIGDGKAFAATGTKPVYVAVPAAAYGADNAGATVKIKAVPATADYSVALPETTLTFKDKAEVTVPAEAVKGIDAAGLSKDAVQVTYVDGVKWKVNGKAVTPSKTKPATVVTGKDVKVEAAIANTTDYVFAKDVKTTWVRADLTDLKDTTTAVEAPAPTAIDAPLIAKDVITLTGKTGVVWEVTNGPDAKRTTKTYKVADGKTSKVPAGENPVVTVKAESADYSITGTASWDAATLKVTSTKQAIDAPAKPVVKTDADGTSKDTVTLTGVAGVAYKVGTSADDKKAKSYAPLATKSMDVLVPADASVFAVVTNTKETEFKAGATTSWNRTDLGLKDTKGQIEITKAPTGVDMPAKADKITITGVDGVQWKIDNKSVVKVAKDKTAVVTGQSIVAMPINSVDTEMKGKAEWTATDLGLTEGDLKVTVTTAPKGVNAPGVTKDAVELVGKTGVKYTIGKKSYTPKDGIKQTVPMLPTDTLTAVSAGKGYAIDGTASWTGAALGLLNDGTAVAVTAPVANDNAGKTKDTVTITPAANVVWVVDGVKFSSSGTAPITVSTKGKAAIKVEALGKTPDFAPAADGKSTWDLTFVVTKGELKPVAPVADKDAHAVKITQMAGVVWKIDGAVVKTPNKVNYITVPATKKSVVVTAVAENATDAEVTENASTPLSFE